MKTKRVSKSLINQLSEMESNRNKIDGFLDNFLSNYSFFASTIHSQIANNNNSDESELKIASFQYLSSIISCWETFFRDVFIYLNSIDTSIKKSTIEKLELTDIQTIDIEKQIKLHDYFATCFNFQNLSDTKEAFFPVFDSDIFDTAAKHEFLTYFTKPDREGLFSLERIFPDYNTILVDAVEQRHKFIHDANFIRNISYDRKFFQKTETIFLLFPQVISKLLCDKYGLGRIVLANGAKIYHYIFIIDDIIRKDWRIVEKDK